MSRHVVTCTWDEVPHLSAAEKAELLASIPAYQRDARTKGVPALGSGAVYPFPESELAVDPFAIPDHWPRGFGLDTDSGAGWTAAVWLALDRDTGTRYVYDVYKRGRVELAVHVEAIKARGAWIPGVADAAALYVTEHDAHQLIALYRAAGLDVDLAEKAVEAGIQVVWELLSAGRLKVFRSCSALFEEYRLYRRDEHGRIVKRDDHLLDALRYACRAPHRMKTKPAPKPPARGLHEPGRGQNWMA